jgi:hypothetical protein
VTDCAGSICRVNHRYYLSLNDDDTLLYSRILYESIFSKDS